MSLFTTPLTLNDGTGDRIFDYQYQEPGATIAARYNEPAASGSSESRLRAAHMDIKKSGRKRHLLQSSELVALVEPGALDPASDTIVCNVTIEHHPKHAVADIEKRLKLVLAAAGIVGFTLSIVQGDI